MSQFTLPSHLQRQMFSESSPFYNQEMLFRFPYKNDSKLDAFCHRQTTETGCLNQTNKCVWSNRTQACISTNNIMSAYPEEDTVCHPSSQSDCNDNKWCSWDEDKKTCGVKPIWNLKGLTTPPKLPQSQCPGKEKFAATCPDGYASPAKEFGIFEFPNGAVYAPFSYFSMPPNADHIVNFTHMCCPKKS